MHPSHYPREAKYLRHLVAGKKVREPTVGQERLPLALAPWRRAVPQQAVVLVEGQRSEFQRPETLALVVRQAYGFVTLFS